MGSWHPRGALLRAGGGEHGPHSPWWTLQPGRPPALPGEAGVREGPCWGRSRPAPRLSSPVTARAAPPAISGELAALRAAPEAAAPAVRPAPRAPLTCHRRRLAQHQPPSLPLRGQSERKRPPRPAPAPRPPRAPTFLPSRSLTWPSTSAASVIFCHGSRGARRASPRRPAALPGSLSK